MIEVQNISFKYKGQKALVFDGFSLQLEENRIWTARQEWYGQVNTAISAHRTAASLEGKRLLR